MISAFAIIAFAALIHASFQLSVSMLTLLSGHAIGKKAAHRRLLSLTSSFLLGTLLMTTGLMAILALIAQHLFFNGEAPLVFWATASGLLFGLGIAVWAFYYRKEAGTTLWMPRGFARYLSDRTKTTEQSVEAFSLGMTSVVGEFLFIIGPAVVATLALMSIEPTWRIAGVALYAGISLLSLLIVYVLIGSGHNLGSIQRWREQNKRFLQFTAGGGLLVLGFYIYVERVMTVAVMAAHGGS